MKYKDVVIYPRQLELLRSAAQLSAAIRWDLGKFVKIKNKELNSFYNFDFSEYKKEYPNYKGLDVFKSVPVKDLIRQILYFEKAFFSESFKKSDLEARLLYLDGWSQGRFNINPGFSFLTIY